MELWNKSWEPNMISMRIRSQVFLLASIQLTGCSARRDMIRMGKRQELRVSLACNTKSSKAELMLRIHDPQRNFQFFSIWGYAVILG